MSLGLLVLVPASAHAYGPAASASVGHVSALVDGRPIEIAPLAVCTSDGPLAGSTAGVLESGFVRFGPGASTCDTELEAGGGNVIAATAQLSGSYFRFDGLRRYGGPSIRISSYAMDCRATETGSNARLQISGLYGFALPNPVPANHTVIIPSPVAGDPPLARIVVNEVLQPTPPDGSMTVNLIRITLFPEGVSINTGEIVAGTVYCSPDPDFAP